MHSDAQFAGSSSVPAHVEMMGLIGMGNNPMVGATVAVACLLYTSRAMSVKYGNLLNDAAGTRNYTAIAVGRVMTCVLGMVVIRAVSYTHLDVYKRQI